MSLSQFSVKHLLAAAQRKLRQSFGRARSANIWNALSDQVPRSGAVRIWSYILRGSVYFGLDRPSRPTFHLLRRPKDIYLGVFAKGSSFAPVSRQGLRGLIIEFFFSCYWRQDRSHKWFFSLSTSFATQIGAEGFQARLQISRLRIH